MTDKKKGFFATHLDPGGIFGEILFGLIMVLTFTLGAGLTIKEEGPEAVRGLLIAALGCNIAWGIIDGAMYIMGCLLDRGRRNRMLLALKDVTDESVALQSIENEMDGVLTSLLTPAERQAAYRGIWRLSSRAQPERPRILKDDLMGGLAAGLLVILTALPGAIPFLFMQDKFAALRASNAILLLLLFWCGFFWAKFTGVNRILAGLAMTLIGVVLVVAAILLGG
jgi:hypothetical protein